MKSLTSRAVVYCLIIIMGVLAALPNLLPDSVLTKLPPWYATNTLTLGLDLRGGSHLLLAVDTANLLLEENRQLGDELSSALRNAGVPHFQPVATKEDISIRIKGASGLENAVAIIRPLLFRVAGDTPSYLLKRHGDQLVFLPTNNYIEQLNNDAVERSVEVVRRRLDETGLVEPTVTRQGKDGVLVQLPGVDNPQKIRELLGTTAKMSLHWAPNGESHEQTTIVTMPGQKPSELYSLEQRVALEGKHISDAHWGYRTETNEVVVYFKLDGDGARRFAEMTEHNIGRQLAIVLDGKVLTAPVIRSVIGGGSGEISGSFTSVEAMNLALLLRAGALPAPMDVIEERTVGPDLGSDAIAMGISTGLLGALLVFAFMLGIYGRWGLIACVGLAVHITLVFAVLTLFRATLTLPGIAGFILSIGMAVDANILINERIREETLLGRSAFSALDLGFKRAYATILDSNVTTLIAISLLFLFGSGPVRGFAVTMAIGLLVSLFTAIAVTRLIMEWRVRKLRRVPLNIPGVRLLDRLSHKPINVMRGRFIGLIASAVLSVGSIVLFFTPGLNYGIDFSGGSVVEVRAPNTSVEALRDGLQQQNFSHAAIQEFGAEGSYLVRLPMQNNVQGAEQVATGKPVENLKAALLTVAAQATFPRVEMVGPRVSDDFADATILAIVIAGAGMLGYLWLRFESHFAIAATLTLALDITKTIGFFVLAGVEFNLTAIAALLALIGYSVNDKVVVFDRIRENLRATPDKPMLQLLNESITGTLTRTVFTSLTTFLALLPMAVAGGSAVSSFALPMLFGIVIGTSSSVFIAAPILLLLAQRRTHKGQAQLRPTAEDIKRQLALMP